MYEQQLNYHINDLNDYTYTNQYEMGFYYSFNLTRYVSQ